MVQLLTLQFMPQRHKHLVKLKQTILFVMEVQQVYTLSVTPLVVYIRAPNLIVRVGNKLLNAGYNEKFTVEANKVEYRKLRNWQQPGGTLGADDILVLLNGTPLTYTRLFIPSANPKRRNF